MAEDHTHIVSSFDEELTRLNNIISQMGHRKAVMEAAGGDGSAKAAAS